MKADTFRMNSPGNRGASSAPNFKETSIPTPAGSLSPTEGASLLCCDVVVPSVSFSPSSSALAARRVNSRPQGQVDVQKPTTHGYDRCSAKICRQSLTPPLDSMEILSPTVIAARDYYLNLDSGNNINTPPHSSSEINTLQRRIHPALRNITQASSMPRRHSMALEPYLDGLGGMKGIKMLALEVSRRGSATPASQSFDSGRDICVKFPRDREGWMQRVFEGESLGLGSSLLSQSRSAENLEGLTELERQIHNPLDPRYLGNIPFSYTTSKLREWGNVYLFNSATADAFVRAVPMPSSAQSNIRPSSPSADLHQSLSNFSLSDRVSKEEGDPEMSESHLAAKQLVKVRIIPQCKTRKSFFMQKAFPIRKSPTLPSYRINKRRASPPPRYHLRHQREHCQGTKVEILRDAVTGVGSRPRPAVPIHIEYALCKIPLLAAVLLCEHVKRGDIVEIPLPFPEVWEDVVEWVYTGHIEEDISMKTRENVEYLGGKI